MVSCCGAETKTRFFDALAGVEQKKCDVTVSLACTLLASRFQAPKPFVHISQRDVQTSGPAGFDMQSAAMHQRTKQVRASSLEVRENVRSPLKIEKRINSRGETMVSPKESIQRGKAEDKSQRRTASRMPRCVGTTRIGWPALSCQNHVQNRWWRVTTLSFQTARHAFFCISRITCA